MTLIARETLGISRGEEKRWCYIANRRPAGGEVHENLQQLANNFARRHLLVCCNFEAQSFREAHLCCSLKCRVSVSAGPGRCSNGKMRIRCTDEKVERHATRQNAVIDIVHHSAYVHHYIVLTRKRSFITVLTVRHYMVQSARTLPLSSGCDRRENRRRENQ